MGNCTLSKSLYFTHSTIQQRFPGNSDYTINLVKIGDLKIHWGETEGRGGQPTINFIEPYQSTGYTGFGNYISNGDPGIYNSYCSIVAQTKNSCKLRNAGGIYAWMTLGY